jgi:hypothetical protein
MHGRDTRLTLLLDKMMSKKTITDFGGIIFFHEKKNHCYRYDHIDTFFRSQIIEIIAILQVGTGILLNIYFSYDFYDFIQRLFFGIAKNLSKYLFTEGSLILLEELKLFVNGY